MDFQTEESSSSGIQGKKSVLHNQIRSQARLQAFRVNKNKQQLL